MTEFPATPLVDVAGVQLDDAGPLPEATGAEMQMRSKVLWRDDSGAEAGVWSCEPGPSRWVLETHEFIYVAKGRMTVTRDGSSAVEVTSGQSAFFEKGWSGTWDIHEPLLKSYVIF